MDSEKITAILILIILVIVFFCWNIFLCTYGLRLCRKRISAGSSYRQKYTF